MRNVRRPEKYEQIFKRFTEQAHSRTGKPIFSTLREFLCFLAVLGYHGSERIPLEGKTIELDGRVFDNSEQSRDLIYLLALASEKDANILQPDREDEMVTIFEEYAASGFKVLEQWMKECPDDIYGDQAILTAIRNHGFLKKHDTSIEEVIDSAEF